MSYARHRKDANHNSITDVFVSLDCSVLDLSQSDCGFDAVIGYKTQAIMVEIKDGSLAPSRRKLTPAEHSAHLNWRGPKCIVKNNDEAVLVAKLLRARHFSVVSDAMADNLSA